MVYQIPTWFYLNKKSFLFFTTIILIKRHFGWNDSTECVLASAQLKALQLFPHHLHSPLQSFNFLWSGHGKLGPLQSPWWSPGKNQGLGCLKGPLVQYSFIGRVQSEPNPLILHLHITNVFYFCFNWWEWCTEVDSKYQGVQGDTSVYSPCSQAHCTY